MTTFYSSACVRWSSSLITLCLLLLIQVGCNQATESAGPVLVDSKNKENLPDGIQGEKVEAPSEANLHKESAVASKTQKVVVEITAFGDAALNGDIETIRQAIEESLDVNSVDDQQRTALMLAAFNGHSSIVKLLLDQGAGLDQRDAMGRTALMFAATGDNAETVKLLIEAGAAVNAVDTGEKFTALMHAAAEGQLEVVKLLLEHKADPTLRDIDGDSALDFASRNGHAEVVKLLAN